VIDGSLLVPVQSLLVHIGPHKTGTTALQSAFHAARDFLEAYGVRYAGQDRQPLRAVSALIGKSQRIGEPPPSMFHWDRLAGEINDATEPRVVMSCESFADADADIPLVLADTFKSRQMHVAVTLRPLPRIFPSAWQQYVQNGMTMSYPKWLTHIFDEPDAPRSQRFWWRHDHGALVARWVDVVGPDNLTVVVADETRKGMLLRSFEALTGLPDGLLQPEPGLQNRSLSYGEAELHRRLNLAFKENGWSEVEYAKLIRHGMVANLQRTYTPGPEAPRLVTPRWAVDRAAAAGAASAERISALGVRVIGDLGSLGVATAADIANSETVSPPVSLPMKAVTQAVIGVIIGSRTDAPIEIMQSHAPRGWKRVGRAVKRRVKRFMVG
jgi:hypothetical protein